MKDKDFIDGEIKIRKEHDIGLLRDLLYYFYMNNDNYNERHVLNALHDNVLYEDEEKNLLLEEAKREVKEKYNVELS